jgi:pimeloyl-ACP methyl ester carboxylesterase
MPQADVNGQTLAYDVYGDSGEPLLCIHGLSADRAAWALQIQAWSQEHRLVVFDNRDVGESSYATAEYTTADMARDALGLADHLELDRFHLLGVSLGGMAAQELALAAPERVLTLTLVVSQPGTNRELGEMRAHLLGQTFRHLTREERIDHLLFLCYTEDFFANREAYLWLRDALLQHPHPQDPEGFARQALAGGRHDARDRLGQISLPVHVIGAARDILLPVWKSEELAGLIPGAKLTVMEEVGHGAMWEKAEDFNRLVLEFLAATPSEAVR